jgi:hypothetical protein
VRARASATTVSAPRAALGAELVRSRVGNRVRFRRRPRGAASASSSPWWGAFLLLALAFTAHHPPAAGGTPPQARTAFLPF